MLRLVLFLALAGFAAEASADTFRQLGPHVHGVSTLDIAVEGTSLSLELQSPGADIVGFESPAVTDAEKAAVTHAATVLADPLSVFAFPAAAGCKVTGVTQDMAQVSPLPADTGNTLLDRYAAQSPHSDVFATYALTCANPHAINGIDFHFFALFPNTEVVNVQLISDRGEGSYFVQRAAPHLDLAGAV